MSNLAPEAVVDKVVRRPVLSALIARTVLASLIVLVWHHAFAAQDPARSDATGDWILVKAVASGLSPFEDVRLLGTQVGVPFKTQVDRITTQPVVVYRTSGGLLAFYPLLLFDWSSAHLVVGLAGLLCFLWMMLYVIPLYCRQPVESLLLPLAVASASVAFTEATFWGSISAVIAAATAWAMYRPTFAWSGLPLGMATITKLYPGLLLVPLAIKRRGRSTFWTGSGIALMMSAIGTLVFGLGLSESARLLQTGSRGWLEFEGNLSLGAVISQFIDAPWIFAVVLVVGICAVIAFSMRRPLGQGMAFAACASVLISPISWVHYDVLLVPSVIWLWSNHPEFRVGRIVAIAWLVVEATAIQIAEVFSSENARTLILAVRIAVTLAMALSPTRLWRVDGDEELLPRD